MQTYLINIYTCYLQCFTKVGCLGHTWDTPFSFTAPWIWTTNYMEQNTSREANSFSANQEFPRILWNHKVFIMFTRSHLFYSPRFWFIKSKYYHPISFKTTLILSSYIRSGFLSVLLSTGFPTKNMHAFLFSSICVTWVSHLFPLHLIMRITFDENY